ncbi:Adaptor protein complex AP-3 delta subunit [Xylona heveae TC161]|uniref:AP-3 complex subunit delta n=1 Tax=Xylona heveae (strain CBS 132557 / TC161) TaxID=1328760 RepID=A0A165K2H6_XYLHT|nr:Adaptor protein complex AP-3 delta subunit [Xylona heveae TC161]KZF26909.1 Adaptor protein complex AP-3 delta subunit [Xylona heveae TC161]
MFEKSLYDLIRGLRNHKGNEREYIQSSLRECRSEIKSQDMDLKATALLKLIYLEMFGHDMSWAAFNVLEVMSSAKYPQKRVGYLGAVQSFRPDTDVLMLATNLLKKDLTSPTPTTLSLPLGTVPHIITPSLALSLLSDLLTRLTHHNPAVRKKTIATLYRLALVYPETLRPAWPKIKERLMDEDEDSSVTAAIVNVVCELGWRRPQDFLPLAPRLFELLVDGGNNWMAIKIIKLFATLTPLEPRLVRKLLPPLTTIIRTTPAMSLLYECINGIIQGGILESVEGTSEGEEIAALCVGKLRGMAVVEGDPNLKYVALLAFNKIVISHPHLVAMHSDVILDCIDDADISIRFRALELVVGMVNSENLVAVVGRLMRQLRNAPNASSADDPLNSRGFHSGIEPAADSDDEDPEESLRAADKKTEQTTPLPDEYRVDVIRRILEMCSKDTYSNVADFEWYIEVLVQLVKYCPAATAMATGADPHSKGIVQESTSEEDVAFNIGSELQNVAVRVRSVRLEATRTAETLILVEQRDKLFPSSGRGGQAVLGPAAWIVGEYAELLADPGSTVSSLLHSSSSTLPADILAVYIQAIPKVFAYIVRQASMTWNPEQKTMTSLQMARIIHFLEPLAKHPNLEIQERAVEYLELIRLASEAAASQAAGEMEQDYGPPLLLTQALPSLFEGFELNPVAPGAQAKVPLPDGVDLETPINSRLQSLLETADYEAVGDREDEDEFYHFYNDKPTISNVAQSAASRLDAELKESSYQQETPKEYLDPVQAERRKAERRERNKDDPFYIANEDSSSAVSTPLHNILRGNNGEEVDIDSIPIMDLDLNGERDTKAARIGQPAKRKPKPRKTYEITGDENIVVEGRTSSANQSGENTPNGSSATDAKPNRGKKSLLQVDSSGLGTVSLGGEGDDDSAGGVQDIQKREEEEAEMARAMKEVERLRLEMQRASERVEAAKDVPPEGTMIKKKKKKKQTRPTDDADATKPKKKKSSSSSKKDKTPAPNNADAEHAEQAEPVSALAEEPIVSKPKKKKKRRPAEIIDDASPQAAE